ncbi:MAG TPA: hypothetical protein VGG38_00345 [Acidimicrobiales bacterium]|jgi:hypothetical protein
MARRSAARVLGLSALSLSGLGALVLGLALPAAAQTTTSVVTSASVNMALRLSMPGHSVSDLDAYGQIEFTGHSLAIAVALPETAGRAKGQKAATLDLRGELINGTVYLTLPPSLVPKSDSPNVYYAVSASTASDFSTALSQTAVAVTYARILLDSLATSQALHKLGSRTIDGVRVTGIRTTLSLAQLFKVMPALSPVTQGALTPMANTPIPITAWVDGQGRLVEAVLTQPKGVRTWIAGTIRFSNFNAPVTVNAPPAASEHPISKSQLATLTAANPFATGG